MTRAVIQSPCLASRRCCKNLPLSRATTWSRLSETRNPVSARPVHVTRVSYFCPLGNRLGRRAPRTSAVTDAAYRVNRVTRIVREGDVPAEPGAFTTPRLGRSLALPSIRAIGRIIYPSQSGRRKTPAGAASPMHTAERTCYNLRSRALPRIIPREAELASVNRDRGRGARTANVRRSGRDPRWVAVKRQGTSPTPRAE